MTTRGRRLAWWGLAAAAVAVAACAQLFLRRDREPNVLLITLDTTRADRLGCYGYQDAETPALDALAASGIRFEQAFATAPLTLPSHATLLTGRCPPEHGLHDNGRGALPPGIATLPEIFRQHGFRTAAFLASFSLDRQFGLNRGFDVYADGMTVAGGSSALDEENRADVVADRALAWLRQRDDRPFFCWAHFYDPHAPYDPPEPYRSRHVQKYDGEIAFLDSQVRRLLDFVAAQPPRRRTLVVVVGDHGESFGEHDEFGHGAFVYDATLRVPLILSLPGRIPAGRSVGRTASLADVAATVLGVMGWPRPAGMREANLLADGTAELPCYGESEFLFNSHGWAPLHSLTTRQWKYIQCPVPELYDRMHDPAELTNLAVREARVLSDLDAQLAAMTRGFASVKAGAVSLDAAAIAKLQSLGYLAGSKPTPSADRMSLQDPKAMWPIYRACRQAEELIGRGRPQEALALLLPAAARSPESKKVQELLVAAYSDLNDFARAEPHVRTCLKMDPGDRAMWVDLGIVLLEQRQFAEAEKVLAQTLELPRGPREPVIGPSRVSRVEVEIQVKLGIACLYQGDLQRARTHYEQALRALPDHVMANEGLAHVDMLQGKRAAAIDRLQALLKRAPEQAAMRKNLGALLCGEKRYAEAVQELREGLRRTPDDVEFRLQLAWVLATCPEEKLRDGREAVTLAAAAVKAGGENGQALDVLAAAQAESGDLAKAVATAEQALALARNRPATAARVAELEARLASYRAGRPWRSQ